MSCFHVIFPGFTLLMNTIGKLNDKEIALNFRYMYHVVLEKDGEDQLDRSCEK